MSTATYRPTSDIAGKVALDVFGSGTGHYGLVNEVSEDVTNGVYNLSNYPNYIRDIYGFGLSNLGTINSITVYARCSYTSSGATGAVCRFINYNGTTEYDNGSDISLTTSDATYSYAFTTNLAWVNGFGIKLKGSNAGKGANDIPYCYQLWIVVDYTGVGGGNAQILVAGF
jgi:hypothetical protein